MLIDVFIQCLVPLRPVDYVSHVDMISLFLSEGKTNDSTLFVFMFLHDLHRRLFIIFFGVELYITAPIKFVWQEMKLKSIKYFRFREPFQTKIWHFVDITFMFFIESLV